MLVQDEPRRELLQLSGAQLEDVARVANRYPDIQLTHSLASGASVAAGGQVDLIADLERDLEGDLRPVDAPRLAPWAFYPCIAVRQLPDTKTLSVALPA